MNDICLADINLFPYTFNVVFEGKLEVFLHMVADRYHNYFHHSYNDEIPSAETIMDFDIEMYGEFSPLQKELDLNFAVGMHYDNPDKYPYPETEEWNQGEYDAKVSEILYELWDDAIRKEYIEDIETAMVILNLVYRTITDEIVNQVICEVW